MTFEEMHAVVATAHNHGLKVTGHCRATEGIKNALRAGYDTLEHGTFVDDEAIEMILKRNTPVIPALYVIGSFALVWNTLVERPTESIAGLGLVAVGLPFYWYWSARPRKRAARRPTSA